MARHGRAFLRVALPIAALTVVLSGFATSPAKAVTYYPYCLRAYTAGGSYDDCSYSTDAQCRASASGRVAECFRDPFYPGAPGSAYVIKQPRYPYSPFGSNIDPNYDPYRGWEQQWAPATQHKRQSKKKKH